MFTSDPSPSPGCAASAFAPVHAPLEISGARRSGPPRPWLRALSGGLGLTLLLCPLGGAQEATPATGSSFAPLMPGEPVTYEPFYPERWKEHGTSLQLVPWTGTNVVFLTTRTDFDPHVMGGFVRRLDAGWQLYAELTGRRPEPLKQIGDFPTIVAVPGFDYTCGYGCGYVGATGIEVGAFYDHDYPLLEQDATAVPHYYFYEMGRNFYTFGDRHSLFTTGYAVFMRYVCLDTLGCPDPDAATRATIEAAIDGYQKSGLSFLEAFTTLGGMREKEPRLKDENGVPIQPSDQPVIYASAMLRLHREWGGNEGLRRFYRHLAACPEVAPDAPQAGERQALNWLVAASAAAGRDLSTVFADQWRLPLTPAQRQVLAGVPWSAEKLEIGRILRELEATRGLTLMPYLQAVGPDTMAVLWRTDEPAYGWVEYGETAALGHRQDTVAHGLRAANTTAHRVLLTGLEPGRTYYYRAGIKPIREFGAYQVDFGPECFSSLRPLRTLPASEQTVTAVILNDLHNRPDTFTRLGGALAGTAFDFSLFNGDCLADLGAIADGFRPLAVFLGGAEAASRPAFLVRGNHETRGGFARGLPEMLAWPGGQPYFAFNAGPVRFVVLDCGEDKPDSHAAYSGLVDFDAFRREETEWLRAELSSEAFRTATWRVLVSHIPIDRSAPCQALWGELLAQAPIDLAIHGHTHRPAFDPADGARRPYPVAIGGGPQPGEATAMVLKADADRLALTVRRASGELAYPPFVKLRTKAGSEVITYPAPEGEPRSPDYEVWAGEQSVDVYPARTLDPPFADREWDFGGPYAFANFDLAGEVQVRIRSPRSLAQTVVRPASAEVTQELLDEHTLLLRFPGPRKVSVEPDGKRGPLLLFANPIESDPPAPGDAGVKWFGPGIHDVGRLELRSDETLYLAGGAVLKGGIIAQGQNIRILGRGILDGSDYEWRKGPTPHVISIRCTNVDVSGITIRGASHWTVVPMHSRNVTIRNVKICGGRVQNDDGINPCNSQDVLITDCFIRSDDDCVALKGINFSGANDNVERVTVENSTLWCDRARIFLLGHESRAAFMRDITLRNLDIIHFAMTPFLFEPGEEMRLESVTVEDVRIHGAGQRELIRLRPVVNQYMQNKVPGHVRGVTFRHVRVEGEPGAYRVQLQGADEAHAVRDIAFEGVTILGQPLQPDADRLETGPHVHDLRFGPPPPAAQN